MSEDFSYTSGILLSPVTEAVAHAIGVSPLNSPRETPANPLLSEETNGESESDAVILSPSAGVTDVLEAVSPEDAPLTVQQQRQLAAQRRATAVLGLWPYKKAVVTMCLPALCSMVGMGVYQLADAAWVGHICGQLALSACSLALPIELSINGLLLSGPVGGATMHAQYLGERDWRSARRTMGNTIFYVVVSAIIVACLSPAAVPLLRVLGATEGVEQNRLDPANNYIQVLIFGGIASALAYWSNNWFRAESQVFLSCVGLLVQAVLNAALDPAWMYLMGWLFGDENRLVGAAVSTIFSYVANALFGIIYFLILRRGTVSLQWSNLIPVPRLLGKMAGIGIGNGIAQIGGAALMIVLNLAAANWTGTHPASDESTLKIAVCGALVRTLILGISLVNSAYTGLLPIAAYCAGAKMYRRLRQCFLFTLAATTIVICIVVAILEGLAPQIAHMFSTDPQFHQIYANMLRISAPMLFVLILTFLPAAILQSQGKPVVGMIALAAPQLLGPIPGIIICSKLMGTSESIAIGVTAGAYIALVPCLVLIFINRKALCLDVRGLPEDPLPDEIFPEVANEVVKP